MLIPGAVYRFNRSRQIRYYLAARTRSGIDFLYPVSLDGSRVAEQTKAGREYVILYLLTRWGKLGAGGYWLNPKRAFDKIYVTDATLDDLVLMAERVDDLPNAHLLLDDILNRTQVEVDMEVWGAALRPDDTPDP
ncbi:MAG: hypothetical protein KF753_23170 [Caldilineaceae bacterium]|nr:hypothetical protein [Caldilineaceae bacterium]